MSEQELIRIRNTYRTAQHLVMGHIYRDLMALLKYVQELRDELTKLKGES